MQEGIEISTDGLYCICKVAVKLPAQPKPEAPDPKAQAPK